MSTVSTLEDVLKDPCTSHFVRNIIAAAEKRDIVDVIHDLEVLIGCYRDRFNKMLAEAGVDKDEGLGRFVSFSVTPCWTHEADIIGLSDQLAAPVLSYVIHGTVAGGGLVTICACEKQDVAEQMAEALGKLRGLSLV